MNPAIQETFASGREGSTDRAFGLVFATAFLVAGLLPLRHNLEVRLWALLAGAVLLLVTLAKPAVLHPANLLWTRLGMWMHAVVSPVALGVVYFAVAVPTGLLLRIAGKDPLRLRLEPEARSYWQPRKSGTSSMKNQF